VFYIFQIEVNLNLNPYFPKKRTRDKYIPVFLIETLSSEAFAYLY
jgi:hypothetical protein